MQERKQLDPYWKELEPLLDFPLRVVPIMPSARKPLWSSWEFGAPRKNGRYGSSSTTDRARLRRVTEGEVRPDIGVPHGQKLGHHGFSLVLDVDAENGGLDSWVELCSKIGAPPQTATVLTKTENCFHKFLSSSSQWRGAPATLGPGLEVKRAGHLSIVPPSRGYAWGAAPWDDPETGSGGIWPWHELDAYLGLVTQPTRPKVVQAEPGIIAPETTTWTCADDYIRAIASAEPGGRTDALLRMGGKVAYATATGRGLGSPEAVEAALWAACQTNGLLESYGEEKLYRKIEVYLRWSDPGKNPLLTSSSRLGGAQGGIQVLAHFRGKGSRADQVVFEDLARFARHEYKPYADRWAKQSTGLGRGTVQRALRRLEANGLIEKGPGLWNEGKRATNTYRLSEKGKALLVPPRPSRQMSTPAEPVDRSTSP